MPEKSVNGEIRGRTARPEEARPEDTPGEESFQGPASRLEALLSAIPDILLETDASNVYTWTNQAGIDFFGEDVIGRKFDFYRRDGEQDTERSAGPEGEGENVLYSRSWVRRKDGESRFMAWRTRVIRDRAGNVSGTLSLGRDITHVKKIEERRTELEAQLQHQHRLEMVGTLAGGVAHDFNNILTGISGFTSLALQQLPEDSPVREDLSEVLFLSRRAEDVTRKLLAFSRRHNLQMTDVDVNELIGDLMKTLRRLIPENIELVFTPGPNVGMVRADPGQMEQVIVNLTVNSRDAMPAGGSLTIETADVDLDEDYTRGHIGAKPGPHVMMAVSDSGCGMDEGILKHLFEPFFTTKEPGVGTGLGLATVYGIVKQHGGNIWAYSEPGKGSTFKLYLPRLLDAGGGREKLQDDSRGGTETILIVEDEASILRIAKRSMESKGYRVYTAGTPSEAERILEAHGTEIHLIVTDVMLPEMNGRVLFETARAKYPHLRGLFMSGYTDDVIVRKGMLDSRMPFIQKPFTQDALARKVRDVLEGERDDE